MPYQDSVTSTIQRATTSVTSANLGASMFVTANSYFSERIRGYSSFQEVRDDDAIPSDSNAYAALRLAFSANGCAVPFYLGRREVDTTILAPDPDKIGVATEYKLTITTGDDSADISYVSGTTETALQVVTAIQALIVAETALAITSTIVDETIEIVRSSTDDFIIDSVENLVQTFETTEDASDLLSALTEEDNENWYFLTCEDHTQEFVLEMAAEIEATGSSDYPKMYFPSIQEEEALVTIPSVPVDTLAKLQELGYVRTAGEWHDEADTLFPEVYATGYMGQFTPGVSTWKFITPTGIGAAENPTTGKNLTKAKQGYIGDRNASWYGEERGTNFRHGGKVAGDEWIDVVRARDYLNDRIETGLLNLLLNQPGGKIPFTESGKASVRNVIDGVLSSAVNIGILKGYVPTTIPENTPFADQAARILQDVEWTGYLAGAVHFIVVSGTLTYEDETLA